MKEHEETDDNASADGSPLGGDRYLDPRLVAEYMRLGVLKPSAAVALYVAASVVSAARQGRHYFECERSIAARLGLSAHAVEGALRRAGAIGRDGWRGKRRRRWILKGFNDGDRVYGTPEAPVESVGNDGSHKIRRY